MKELKRAKKILEEWTKTDMGDAVMEVCEVIEILDKYLQDNKKPVSMADSMW